MKTRWIVLPLVVAGLAGGGFWYWKQRATADAAAAIGPTLTVTRGDLVETAAASGTIEPHVQVDVKSHASGEVIEVLVEEGQSVEAGQLLVRLDPVDAERAVQEAKTSEKRIRAQLAETQASLSVAELEEQNASKSASVDERGAEMGLVAPETARTSAHSQKVAAANIKLRKAELGAGYTDLESAKLTVADAEKRLAEMEIRAPIAGTVLSIEVEKGSIVSSAVTNVSGGSALLTLADLTDLRVIGAIDEAQIGRVKPGQEVVIRVDAYPNRQFAGKVEKVSPLGKTVSSVVTFNVEIVVTDEHASLLRSGMSADLEIITGRLDDVLLVPLMSVQSKGRRRTVTLASGEQKVIQTGATDGSQIVVESGLQEGDVIAASAVAAPSKQQGGPNPMRMMRAAGRR